MQYTVEQIKDIIAEAKTAAKQASQQFVDNWKATTGGNEYGEPMYCGFASTNIYGIKGNTKAGRAMKAAGLSKNYEGAYSCLLYTSPSPRDGLLSRMPSSA